MKNYPVEEIKEFISELLKNEKYDSFYLYEARIKTELDYYINGRLNKEFFDEVADMQEYVYWKDIKQTVSEPIKGDRLPVSFKLLLMFNRDNITRLVEMNNLPVNPDDVSALFMNVYYENSELNVTTGTSLKIFTLDKTLENMWDESVGKYYI